MGACVIKEQAIARVQYLDLMYSQLGTLYDIFPDSRRPGTSKTPLTPFADGIIGSMSQTSRNSSPSNPGKKISNSSNAIAPQSTPNPSKKLEVNFIQANPKDKNSKGKNNGKGKAKADTPKKDSQKSCADDGSQRKPKYPCLICDEEHYTKDCPRRAEVSRLLKGT